MSIRNYMTIVEQMYMPLTERPFRDLFRRQQQTPAAPAQPAPTTAPAQPATTAAPVQQQQPTAPARGAVAPAASMDKTQYFNDSNTVTNLISWIRNSPVRNNPQDGSRVADKLVIYAQKYPGTDLEQRILQFLRTSNISGSWASNFVQSRPNPEQDQTLVYDLRLAANHQNYEGVIITAENFKSYYPQQAALFDQVIRAAGGGNNNKNPQYAQTPAAVEALAKALGQ